MVTCAVIGCTERTDKKSARVTFHRFPRNSKKCALWVNAVGRENWQPKPTSFLCSKHFVEGDFNRTSPFRVYLKCSAVPSIFPSFPLHVQKGDWPDMSGRGRPRGSTAMRRGPTLKVMMNMQAASVYNHAEHVRPLTSSRGRGRPRGSRGRKQLLLANCISPPPTNKRRMKELLPLDSDGVTPPVTKRRRKELRLDSDDEFSDMDIGSLIPQSYHKGNSEDQLSRVERCRLCDKPAVDSTSLSTCTTTTKIQMYQKLDKIVSTDRLTLKQKHGVLCSRCSRLLNYVDRIEVELSMLKKTIVECIHKKHNLYVPDESLNFDVVSGEEANVLEDFVNLQENNSVREKQTASYSEQYPDSRTEKSNFSDAESDSQVDDPYGLEEDDDMSEIPHELASEIGENGDIGMCAEYLEPMFEETVVSNQEEETAADVLQGQDQHLSEAQSEEVGNRVEVGKSFTSIQQQTDVSNNHGRRDLRDDLDVKMLIEELTADSQEGHDAGEKNVNIQDDRNSGIAIVKDVHQNEQWRKMDTQQIEGGTDSPKSAEIISNEINVLKMNDKLESRKSELHECQESDGIIQERETSSEIKKWKISAADVQNKEILSNKNKVICYDAGEWEDDDAQLTEKDVTVQSEENSRNTSEQNNETVAGVAETINRDNVNNVEYDVSNEEIHFEGKENEALRKVEKPGVVIDEDQFKNDSYEENQFKNDSCEENQFKNDSCEENQFKNDSCEENQFKNDSFEENQFKNDSFEENQFKNDSCEENQFKNGSLESEIEKMEAEDVHEEKVRSENDDERSENDDDERSENDDDERSENDDDERSEKDERFENNVVEVSNDTGKEKSENNDGTKQEMSKVVVEVEQQITLADDSDQEKNFDDSEILKKINVLEKIDVEGGEKMDTGDEDEKLSEMKWTSDSENEGMESNDDEVANLEARGEVTDDDHTTEESNAETVEICHSENVSEVNVNGDGDNVKSPKIDISEMFLDKESVKPENEIDYRQESTDVDVQQKDIETVFQDNDADLGVQEEKSDIHKDDSNRSDVEEQIREEEPKIENLDSSANTEATLSTSSLEEKEDVNIDERQEEKSIGEGIDDEQITDNRQKKVSSAISDDQFDTHVPAEEGESEIEVLEYKRTEESSSIQDISANNSALNPCAAGNRGAEPSEMVTREKPIADMIEEHLASILAEEPLGGEQGELFSMDVDSITNITEKSSVSMQGGSTIGTLQTEESVISILEEPVASTQGNELFTDVSDEKSVIIIDEDEETNSQSAMLAGMGLIGQPEHALSDLCGATSDVECVDISSD